MSKVVLFGNFTISHRVQTGVRNYTSSFRIAATRLVGSHKMGGTLVDELLLVPSSPLPNCALVSIRLSRPRRHSYRGDSRESTGDGTLVFKHGPGTE